MDEERESERPTQPKAAFPLHRERLAYRGATRGGAQGHTIEPLRSRSTALIVAVLVLMPSACARTDDATCTGQTVRLIRPGVLTVGTDFAYPPFAFDDPDTGEPSGFDVELSQAIAEQLGVKLLLVNRTSGALVPGVLAQRHDLAASAQLDRPQLRREVCVSAPYLDADLGLLARPGEPPSVTGTDDLDGRTIGVVNGSRAERWLRAHLGTGARVVRFEAPDDLPPAVVSRELDAAIDDLPVLEFAAVRSQDLTVVGSIQTGEDFVLAGAPDNQGLMQLVDEAIAKLKTNGKLESLLGRWFGR